MPVGGEAVDARVLAHRRYNDAVGKLEAARREWIEEGGHYADADGSPWVVRTGSVLSALGVVTGNARYLRNSGVAAASQATASMHPTPPLRTENGAPSQFATVPASSSPSCGPPMKKTIFTPIMRPRSRSGVSSWRTILRITMLMVSATPVSASAANVIQKLREKPKMTVASPYRPTAQSSTGPRRLMRLVSNTIAALIIVAPTAGAA